MGIIINDTMSNGIVYNGNMPKFGVTIDTNNYIVKQYEVSPTEVFSEHVASTFIRNLGIPCQSTRLGTYSGNLLVVIKDFTDLNKLITLHSYKDIRQCRENGDITTKSYTYDDVVYMIEQHSKMNDTYKQAAINQFWQMFICDAILGNRDRHHGNWGYLTYPDGYRPAPIYDNGSSLFPDVYRLISEFTSDEYKFIELRAEKFPASLFRIVDDKKGTRRTNYNEILGDLRVNKILAKNVKDLREKVGFNGILKAIVKAVHLDRDLIPDIYRRFYVEIVCVRYLHLIERLPIEKSFKITSNALKKVGGII